MNFKFISLKIFCFLLIVVFFPTFLFSQSNNENRKSRRKKTVIENKKSSPNNKKPENVVAKPKLEPSVAAPTESVIMGLVIDEATGEPLVGATVLLKGAETGANTDLDGKFSLKIPPNVAPVLQVSYTSYNTKEISGIDVKELDGKPVQIALAEETIEVGEVLIETTLRQESDIAAKVRQMNNMQISDVFSGETVLRLSSDLTIGTALSRMPGVSLIEDRFLVIRGLYERYNIILLNGAQLPVIGTDRQTFDFANLPSNMTASLQLVKSGRADQIGSYAGGMINVETPNMPEERKISINYQLILNTRTSFTDVYRQKADNKGALGYLNSVKPFLPSNFPSIQQAQAIDPLSDEGIALAKTLHNNVVPEKTMGTPGQNFSVKFENVHKIGKGKLGYVAGLNMSKVVEFEDKVLNIVSNFDEGINKSPVTDAGFYKNYFEKQGLNAYANASFQNDRNKIAWYNWFSLWQENLSSTNIGSYVMDPETNEYGNYYFTPLRFRRTNLYTTQAKGEHLLGSTDPVKAFKVEWLAFLNLANSVEPGFRAMNYLRDDSTMIYHYDTTIVEDYEIFEKTFSSTQSDQGGGLDLNVKKNITVGAKNFNLKGGLFFYLQNRRFDSRFTALIANHSEYNLSLSTTDLANLDGLFAPENIGRNGFIFKETTTDSNRYVAFSYNVAPYIMGDYEITDKFGFMAGLRLEAQNDNIQHLAIADDSRISIVNRTKIDVLPSVTFRYKLTEKMNLKLSNYQSVSRPTQRELSTFMFYNLLNAVKWTGNPNLQRTYISNVDLRWEWFPTGLDQISFTLFYKHFNNPIEQYVQESSIGVIQQYSLVNRANSSASGMEIEIRKNLGFIHSSRFFQNLTVYGNLSLLQSRVNSNFALFSKGRSLQGQSPYLVNSGLYYTAPKPRLTVALFYSVSGPRIAVVGTGPNSFPDIYELPRHVLDLQVSKKIGKHFEVKAAFQDMINQPIRTAQLYGSGTSFDPNRDQVITNVQRGFRTILSVTYTY